MSSVTAADRAQRGARRAATVGLAGVVAGLALLVYGALLQGVAISLLGVGSGKAATVPGVLVAAVVAHLPLVLAVVAGRLAGGWLGRRVLVGALAELGSAFLLALWVWPF